MISGPALRARRRPGRKPGPPPRQLGLDALPEDFALVKQAFRRAVMRAHPDRGGDTETVQRLNQAFSVLKAHFQYSI